MKFECKRCGECCSPHDENGFKTYRTINYTEEERQKIQEFLPEEEVPAFVNISSRPCIYLFKDSKEIHHCRIREQRPDSCRKWPWVEANKTIEGQKRSAAKCPGIIVEEDSLEWKTPERQISTPTKTKRPIAASKAPTGTRSAPGKVSHAKEKKSASKSTKSSKKQAR